MHNEEFHGLSSSPNITRLMKKNGTRRACRVEERLGACRIWWGNLREKDYLEGVDIDGNIKLIFKKYFGRSDLDCYGLE